MYASMEIKHVTSINQNLFLLFAIQKYICININFYWLICITPSWSLCFWQKGGVKFVCFDFTLNPLLMSDKKGEKYLSLYACLNKELCLCIYIFVLQIGEKDFDLCLLHVLSPYLHTYSCASLSYIIVYLVCMS